MDKYRNKYRIPSVRLQSWNYRWNAAYFITICTQNREHYFGKIGNTDMLLTQAGNLADLLWHEILNHANNVELGEFVVMPNHIHGILILTGNEIDQNIYNTQNTIETRHALSLQSSPQYLTIGQTRFQNQGKNSVSSIIGSYKSVVTKYAHRLGLVFEWQSRYYDHIIRNSNEYQRIANYIQNNPQSWVNDKFYTT
ncbi:MAG: transposase [Bacteroidia bacterium]|nr:transposase [Bacteroidia bacterium]